MPNEIERRFLVDVVPSDAQFESSDRLNQGYLAIDGPVVVRLRSDQTGWVLCVKGGSGLIRTEVEQMLEPNEGEHLWQLTADRRVSKLRQTLRLDSGEIAELDTFDDLAGLRIVEVEFSSVDAAQGFVPPAWFGLEVTEDSRWSNVGLAITGRPDALPGR